MYQFLEILTVVPSPFRGLVVSNTLSLGVGRENGAADRFSPGEGLGSWRCCGVGLENNMTSLKGF